MIKIFALIISVLTLISCGSPYGSSKSDPKEKKITSFSFDGVKRIDAGITDGQDTNTYTQPQYPVGGSSRLLIRFESFRGSKGSVLLGKEDNVWLRVTVVRAEDYETALAQFKVCPLIRGDWMNLANWKSAHPFSREGRWANEGGDFDEGACVKGEKNMKDDPNNETETDQLAIYFKITRWFKDYLVSRNVNFGHILIGGSPIQVFGDASGSYSPRVMWAEDVK